MRSIPCINPFNIVNAENRCEGCASYNALK